jgi:hypothetical protein
MRRIRTTQAVLVGSATVAGVLIGLATNVASDQQGPWPGPIRWVQNNPWWALLVLVVLAVAVAIILGTRDHTDRTGTASDLTLAQVTDQLTVVVAKQWQDEAQLRRLNDPYPLPVAWHPVGPDLVEPWEVLRVTATGWPGGPPTDPAGWATGPAELAGTDNDLADRLAHIPTGRLIVLGEPGAGKTMLLTRLVLDLLSRRQTGDPVPVLISLAGWNPVDQDLPTWLAARLIVDHPALAEPASPRAAAVSRARALWDQRLLLPILDGLDELPEGTWSRAVTRLNDALAPRQGLVLASRMAAYRQAVTPTDPAAGLPVRVWGATGVSLRPLAPDDVRAYLRRDAASQEAAARWAPVLATLGTSTPVARALTTPLLVSLARAIYNPRPGEHTGVLPDPAELCNSTQFPSHAAIQEHLFDGFIPAAYRAHPDPTNHCPWTREQAERWLTFLAQHLERNRQGTTDLAWWELYRTIPRRLVGLVGGLVGGLAFALVGGLVGGLLGGLVAGFVGGLVGGVGVGVRVGVGFRAGFGVGGNPTRGLRWKPDLRSLVVGLMGGLVGVLVGGLAGGVAGGLVVGLVVGGSQTRGLRWEPDLRSVLVGLVGLIGGLVGGFVAEFEGELGNGLMLALAGGLAVGLAFGLVDGFAAMPAGLAVAAEPQAVLARDRRTCWTLTLVFGLGVGLIGGLVGLGVGLMGGLVGVLEGGLRGELVVGVGVGFVVGLVVGLGVGFAFSIFETAWGPFVIARCRHALGGHLPWRLMSFLADAHQKRGVLRQAGAVYQFRHVDLQRRLAMHDVGPNHPTRPSPGRPRSTINDRGRQTLTPEHAGQQQFDRQRPS